MSGAGSMGGRRGKVIIFMALALGLVCAILVYFFLSGSDGGEEGTSTSTGTSQSVVIATQDIGAGKHITSDMVKLRIIPGNAVHPDAYTDAQAVVGKVARYPIAADEQVLSNKVTSSYLGTTGAGDVPLAYIVPEGLRAMAVDVEQVISAGGLVLAGDFVDVIMVATIESDLPPPLDESHLSLTILQNVEVLAIDQEMAELVPEDSTEDGEDGSAADGAEVVSQRVPIDQPDPNPEAITATLAVSPEDAQVLAMADTLADIRLTLRPFGDNGEAVIDEMTDFELVSVPMYESLFETWRKLAPIVKELNDLAGD
jgi:pilus assembly protein CpaB